MHNLMVESLACDNLAEIHERKLTSNILKYENVARRQWLTMVVSST